jgi:hypothetical protein
MVERHGPQLRFAAHLLNHQCTPLIWRSTTFEAYNDRFVGFGMCDAMAQGMTDIARAKNEGLALS